MLALLRKPWVATCSETRDHLSDFVDGELEGRSLLRIRRHLGRCERCRAVLDSLTHMLDGLRSLGTPEQMPTAGTDAAVLARIRDTGQ